MIKLFMYGLVFWLGYRFYKRFLAKPSLKEQVKGQNKNAPLDLADTDVEDARFEDVSKED